MAGAAGVATLLVLRLPLPPVALAAAAVAAAVWLVGFVNAFNFMDGVNGISGAHALIGGVLGDYSLHLGSAVVHRQPGGARCIVPAHARHRGRRFLPFADDDPKTAEVISKALLLARDAEIQDPTILAQIRTAT